MNEAQCKEQGLKYEGGTARVGNEEEIAELKQEAKEIRKLGFRAIVAKSGSNEWGGGDYILYVDPLYLDYKQALSNVQWIKTSADRLEQLTQDYKHKVMSFILEREDKMNQIREVERKTGKTLL